MENLPINAVDIIIIAVLIISGLFAFVRGFVHEVLAVASWIGAAIATLFAFPHVQPISREFITVPLLADVAAGVAIFLVVLIVLSLITRYLSHKVQDSGLGALDRSLGVLFGIVRGAVLVCIAWIGFSWAFPDRDEWPDWIKEARSQELVEAGADWMVSLVPEDLKTKADDAVGKATDEASDTLGDLINPLPKNDASEEDPGYNDDDRGQLQQLLEDSSGDGTQTGDTAQ